jgi:hypothetical protein
MRNICCLRTATQVPVKSISPFSNHRDQVTFSSLSAARMVHSIPDTTEDKEPLHMRKLALILSAFGFIAFAGLARADQKTENTEKTDTSTTLTGKQKTTKTKKIERADGTTTESKVETTRPKTDADKRDTTATPVRNDEAKPEVKNNETKTEEKTTLTGKKQIKTTKKVDNADGSHTESTTTTTEPSHK